jgi:NAD(P)-dependent dehydrogenase (short-subunit alcohol dehydrogenase family)
MAPHHPHVALVTGATSGLGHSAARQLADLGYRQVFITGRTRAKVEQAAAQLSAESGKQVFAGVEVDLCEPASVSAAVAELITRGQKVDVLLLNAGMVAGAELTRTRGGVEVTFASSLIGHHQLTMGLLAAGLLAPSARIVIAGSEAARGDMPMFSIVELGAFAATHHGGDRAAAAEALIRAAPSVKYDANDAYANAKLMVAWWVRALSRKLPAGMGVYAVSPGSAPDTSALRNAGFLMKRIMLPLMKVVPGLGASTEVAAQRYLKVAAFDTTTSGEFYASKPLRATGPIQVMQHPHFHDRLNQDATWAAVVKVSGVDFPGAA